MQKSTRRVGNYISFKKLRLKMKKGQKKLHSFELGHRLSFYLSIVKSLNLSKDHIKSLIVFQNIIQYTIYLSQVIEEKVKRS